jgi:hypothetical protein
MKLQRNINSFWGRLQLRYGRTFRVYETASSLDVDAQPGYGCFSAPLQGFQTVEVCIPSILLWCFYSSR